MNTKLTTVKRLRVKLAGLSGIVIIIISGWEAITALQGGATPVQLTQGTESTQGPSTGEISWETQFWNNQPPKGKRRSGGSRGDDRFCAIAPLDIETQVQVWSSRPVLVWKGPLSRVEIYAQGNSDLLWSQEITDPRIKVLIPEVTLKSGQKYQVLMYETTVLPIPSQQITVQILADENQRQKITQELAQLDNQLQQKNATAEAAAYARFVYFIDQQLWSDAIAEPFLVKNPSPALEEFIQTTLIKNFCKD
ncbi:MAG: hypothetical protein HC835_06795 [Oscillatoriales cyanobacterium RM2_1_1]|nr:hypothetical protein [Oscillatoriales cyanobacterium SM2_3_0]NJO45352.1 hypothetical protein [Oscillatoriales cyanobacterium RM2_1_1]